MKEVSNGKQGGEEGKSRASAPALYEGIQDRDSTVAGTGGAAGPAVQVAGATCADRYIACRTWTAQARRRERSLAASPGTQAGERGARHPKKSGDVLCQAPGVK